MNKQSAIFTFGATTVFEEVKDLDARLRVAILTSLQSFDEMKDAGELTEEEHRDITVHLTKFKNEISHRLVETFTSEPKKPTTHPSLMMLQDRISELSDEELERILVCGDMKPGTHDYDRMVHITRIIDRVDIDPVFHTFVITHLGNHHD